MELTADHRIRNNQRLCDVSDELKVVSAGADQPVLAHTVVDTTEWQRIQYTYNINKYHLDKK